MEQLLALLKKFFGYTSFRPLQAEIIQHILQKKDSLVLMPTGGGKSICYQLPAIYLPGITLVISPLIALMKDQVEGLIANGVPAASLNSMISESEQQQVKQLCVQGKIKLLYISPERVKAEADWFLPRLDVSLIAIDEAHCISHWGHDFRPEYTQLAILKERFPKVPFIALTATADKVTRTDIVAQLRLNDPKIFISSFDRPNLSLTVRRGLNQREKIRVMVHFIRQHQGQSGIIYCLRRSTTEMLVDELGKYAIRAGAYHAGLSPQEREKAQDDFINDRVEVVCATVAFGMGIDKSNIRWVIHFNMPGSIENYYQEIGRAGRDGAKSDTLLFYSLADLIVLRQFAEESGQQDVNLEKLNRMQRYCETDICRRRILLSYFGEEVDKDCGNCDVCLNPPERFDGSILVQKALSAVIRTNQQVAIDMLIYILRGSARADLTEKGYHHIKTYGAGRDVPYLEWKEYIYQMIQLGFLEVDYANGNKLKVTPLGNKVLYGQSKALLTKYRPTEKDTKLSRGKVAEEKAAKTRSTRSLQAQADEQLWNALKQLRYQLAEKEKTPAYIIFTDAALEDMVELKPTTMEEFAQVRGVGQIKLEKYGRTFISLIRFVLKMPKLKE